MYRPGPRSPGRLAAAFVAGAAVAALFGPPASGTPPVVRETHVTLHLSALIVEGGKSRPAGTSADGEAGPDAPARLGLRVPLGGAGGEADVRLEASLISAPPEGDALLRCTARVEVPGRPAETARRDLQLGEEGSGLFDVWGDDARRIVLVLKAERVERAVVHNAVHVGEAVRFVVAIERVDGDRTVPLETNELHTFVGEPVEYSFRRGQDASLESVRLVILPVSVADDLITVQADVSGTLPGPAGPSLLSHTERIVASRRATSTLTATAGTPPAGYRFQVTPDF